MPSGEAGHAVGGTQCAQKLSSGDTQVIQGRHKSETCASLINVTLQVKAEVGMRSSRLEGDGERNRSVKPQ